MCRGQSTPAGALAGLARQGSVETAFEARLEVIMASAERGPDFKPFHLPALSATYFATALICASLSTSLNAGMMPPPLITCFLARGNGGLRASRFGPIVAVEPAAESAWQPAHVVWKILRPFV